MNACPRRRLRQKPRTALLLVLAFGLVALPVLNAWTGLHELTAHAGAAAGHLDHAIRHDRGTATADSDHHDSTDRAHRLLHYTGCCGHTVGPAGPEPVLLCFRSTVARPPAIIPPPPARSYASTPFRPPISA